MKKVFIITVAVASLFTGSVQAIQKAPVNVNKMVKLCLAEEDPLAEATCQGFVSGITAITNTYTDMNLLEPPFCIPDGVGINQQVAVYEAYLKENRSLDHVQAAFLAVVALKEAYPCE